MREIQKIIEATNFIRHKSKGRDVNGYALTPQHNPQGFPFVNYSGMEIPAYAVMRLTEYDAQEHALKMDQPNGDFERLYFANGDQAVQAERKGKCFALLDPSRHKVLIDGDATPGDSFGVKSGEWKLYKNRYGFTILGVDEDKAYVRQSDISTVQGVLTEDLNYNSTATLLLHGPDGSTGMEITVKDRMLESGGFRLPTNARCVAAWTAGEWIVVSANKCPVEAS